MDRRERHEFLKQLDEAIQKADGRLKKSQKRYKRDFDTRVRRANLYIDADDYIFLYPTLQEKKQGKFTSPSVGPYHAIACDQRTFTIGQSEESVKSGSEKDKNRANGTIKHPRT